VSNGPFAGSEIASTDERAEAHQNENRPLHCFHPITFDSTDGVETRLRQGGRRTANIKFKKAIALGSDVVWTLA
jgi:hypothetical protein